MSIPLTYKHANCYINAYINRLHHYKDKNLKMVIGALGINDWFEYGGKDWTLDDYKRTMFGHISDSHCWLEDDEGNVYDFLFEEYKYWVNIRTKKPMKRSGLIEGVSKEELKADGIEYVPAPLEARKALFFATHKMMKTTHDALASGKAKWMGQMLMINP